MESKKRTAQALRQQIAAAECQLEILKDQLAKVEIASQTQFHDEGSPFDKTDHFEMHKRRPLSEEEYQRYGRQMIVPSVGIQGQLRLRKASVLIVGAGGLGCPAAAYLAGAGFGTIGIIDGDEVEISNLHRQTLHTTAKLGMKKVKSAIEHLRTLNPNIEYRGYTDHLTPQNAALVVEQYDIVLDCTDHPTSRYLISDICVLLGKPLVSASALRTDGQLVTLNHPAAPQGSANGGPCYRCIFPRPPPADSVVSCGEGGILGTVVGAMGVLQAGEAIKLVATGQVERDALEGIGFSDANPTMTLYSANNTHKPFRTVRLRNRRRDCFACSAQLSLTIESLTSGSLDYMLFCGVNRTIDILSAEERLQAAEYATLRSTQKEHLLIDVREQVQFDICNIEGSVNAPFSTFHAHTTLADLDWMPQRLSPHTPIHVICKLGNDSQVVVKKLQDMGLDEKKKRYIGDIKGGFRAWKEQVDRSWPDY